MESNEITLSYHQLCLFIVITIIVIITIIKIVLILNCSSVDIFGVIEKKMELLLLNFYIIILVFFPCRYLLSCNKPHFG